MPTSSRSRTTARRLVSGVLVAASFAGGPVTSVASASPATTDAATSTTAPPDTTVTTTAPPTTAAPTTTTAPTTEAPTTTTAPTTEPVPTDATAPNDDVVAPSEPSTQGDVAVANTPMIERSAMVVGATGFKLQYSFSGSVLPGTPTQSSTITPEQSYVWDDGGNRYLQWDYPMPTDGRTTATMTAPLVDLGRPTDYSVVFTSDISRTGGSIAVSTSCQITRDGVSVDLDNDSPFMCEGSSAQAATGAVLAGGTVRDLVWQSVTADITPTNEGEGPKISLGDGTFSTANQEQRIIMNGTAWYPTEQSNSELRKLPYATIENGASLQWHADARNGIRQSEPDSHAQATFAYRIYLDGDPTSYWINGFAESYRYLSSFETSGTCEIFLGSPDLDGAISQRETPFTCSAAETAVNGAPSYDFRVRMADVDTLHQQRDAKTRGVVDACTPDDGPCIQAVGRPALHVTEPESAMAIGTKANTNGEPVAAEWKFSSEWSRDVTDSAEQSFGMKSSAKFILPFVGETDVEISSKTTYGYDLTQGLSYEFKDVSSIPFGAIGRYIRLDAWHTYRGDLYFYGEGDRWYRVTGTEVVIPIEPSAFSGAEFDARSIKPQQGPDLGSVRFECAWDPALKATVLLANDTPRELVGCDIPVEWGDEVPDIKALEDVPKDLIEQAREVQEADATAFETTLEQQANELPVAGG